MLKSKLITYWTHLHHSLPPFSLLFPFFGRVGHLKKPCSTDKFLQNRPSSIKHTSPRSRRNRQKRRRSSPLRLLFLIPLPLPPHPLRDPNPFLLPQRNHRPPSDRRFHKRHNPPSGHRKPSSIPPQPKQNHPFYNRRNRPPHTAAGRSQTQRR